MDFDDVDNQNLKPHARRFLPKQKGQIQPKKVVKQEPVAKAVDEDKKLFSVGSESGSASSSTAEGMEVDDNYVVREIDVYFNPPSDENTQLYLMQYPTRASFRPYDFDERCKEVRVKPESANVEIDVEFDSTGHNAGFHDTKTVKKTLTSSGNLLHRGNYAVGVLQGNKLRPSYKSADGDDDEDEVMEDGHDTQILKGVHQRKQTAASSKKQSWVPLKYHSSGSNLSAKYRQMLMAADHSHIPLTTVSPYVFSSTLPVCGCIWRLNVNIDFSDRSLLSLPLEERFKKWLCEGGEPAYKFSVLKYLAPEVPAEDIIEVLKQHAVLVQGLWVPKNSIAQPGCSELEALAREYVILKFSKKFTITDEEQLIFKTPMYQALREALNKLAIHRDVLNNWKFKVPADPTFAKLYPSVAMQQQQLFEASAPDTLTKMKSYLKPAPMNRSLMPAAKQEAQLKRK
ncbi:hypothetical protein QQ045_007149 [Rhodiola kirilowii]